MKKILFLFILWPSLVFSQSNVNPGIQCNSELSNNPELQILKSKVALGNIDGQTLEILSNDKKPTLAEKNALLKWDSLRQPCVEQSRAWYQAHQPLTVVAIFDKLQSQFKINLSDLYAGKISYGQFAKLRQANADNAKTEAANVIQQNQNINIHNQQQQQQLDQQAQQAQAQDQAQKRALATQMIMNNKPYQVPAPQVQIPQVNNPTNTNCRMIGSTMNCTTY